MDEINEFIEAMRAQGLEPVGEIVTDGKLHRFAPVGSRKDDDHAWYVLHLDTPVSGAFGSWKSGEKVNWTAKVTRTISVQEKEVLKARIAENRRLKEAEEKRVRDQAKEKASRIWKESTHGDHPYLAKKKIHPHCSRVYTGALVVPVTNGGELVGLQFIQEDSEKKFLTGSDLKGSYCLVGPKPTDKLVICEGFATAASIHEATGIPVFAAFNAGNLPETAKAIRKRLPGATIIIAADDDRWTTEPVPNPGVHYASLAASQIKAELRRPIFKAGFEGKPTDFNDLALLYGLNEVSFQIKHGRPSFEEENLPAVRNEMALLEPYPHANGKGKPLATIENLYELLDRVGVVVRYNVISKSAEILIPGETYSIDNRENSALTKIISWAARANMPTDKIPAMIDYLADQNPFNPVATWITSKAWDGEKRLSKLFDTITATDEKTDPKIKNMKEVFMLRWLVSAVAAAFRPNGVSAHGILVFQGEQYLGKTAWFKRLVPGHLVELVADGMILRPEDKDSVKQIISKWLVELGELDATFRRSDIAQLKAFITRDRDILRQAYARKENSFARRTVFFASVNPREFLHDPTGNRRYWTVSCEKINHHHEIDMQQVWAEVYELYKEGESWYLTPGEMDLLNEHNRDFEVVDSMEERIRHRFNWMADKSQWSYVSIKDIMDRMALDQLSRSDFTKCAQVIRKLNGNKGTRDHTGRKLLVPPFKELSHYDGPPAMFN